MRTPDVAEEVWVEEERIEIKMLLVTPGKTAQSSPQNAAAYKSQTIWGYWQHPVQDFSY